MTGNSAALAIVIVALVLLIYFVVTLQVGFVRTAAASLWNSVPI